MTVEAAVRGREQSGGASLEIGRQGNRRDSPEAVGLQLGSLVILLVVTLVIGMTPPGA